MAIIFAWSGCLRKRGELDATPQVVSFADKLEESSISTVKSGIMTGDLLLVADKSLNNKRVTTKAFIDAVAENLRKKISG
jgi:isocitrate dehydrogenase